MPPKTDPNVWVFQLVCAHCCHGEKDRSLANTRLDEEVYKLLISPFLSIKISAARRIPALFGLLQTC